MQALADLQRMAEISDQMLVAARAYQWQQVQALEFRERATALAIRQAASGFADPGGASRLIRQILDNHAAISAIAEPLHEDIKILLEAFSETGGAGQ